MQQAATNGKKLVHLSLPVPLVDSIDRHAAESLSNRSAVIRQAIRSYLKRRGPAPGRRVRRLEKRRAVMQ